MPFDNNELNGLQCFRRVLWTESLFLRSCSSQLLRYALNILLMYSRSVLRNLFHILGPFLCNKVTISSWKEHGRLAWSSSKQLQFVHCRSNPHLTALVAGAYHYYLLNSWVFALFDQSIHFIMQFRRVNRNGIYFIARMHCWMLVWQLDSFNCSMKRS